LHCGDWIFGRDRGTDSDVVEADAAIERLAASPTDNRLAMRDIWLLRPRAAVPGPQRRGCLPGLRNRYRDMAKTLGFEGHIAMAEAMIEGGA
jgi:hypothetical protein